VKVTVLWEDQRATAAKTFGPHELLVACVAEELEEAPKMVLSRVVSIPKKGNGNVAVALKRDLMRLSDAGPVCAVFDRDKIRDLFGQSSTPSCISGIKRRIYEDAPGTYEVVLLDRNVETLVDACCRAQQRPAPASKQPPDQRDRIVTRTAWGGVGERAAVRAAVPSFNRLVEWVVIQLRTLHD
jgi:hypothetical protein